MHLGVNQWGMHHILTTRVLTCDICATYNAPGCEPVRDAPHTKHQSVDLWCMCHIQTNQGVDANICNTHCTRVWNCDCYVPAPTVRTTYNNAPGCDCECGTHGPHKMHKGVGMCCMHLTLHMGMSCGSRPFLPDPDPTLDMLRFINK